MNQELQDVLDAWSKDVGDGRDEAGTRAKADAYVAAHPDEFEGWKALSLEVLVRQIDDYREKGDVESEVRVQVRLWHRFEPQKIGVVPDAQVRAV